MPYPLPSWLNVPAAPNPAEEYSRGLHLGAQIQQQHEQMVAQANEAQVRSQLAMQENERNFNYQQQQQAFQNEISRQDLQMRQQQLAIQKQQADLSVRNAADRFAAEQELARRGPTEGFDKVIMELFPRLYRGTTGAGLGTLMNAMRRRFEPPKITELEYGGQKFPGVMNPNTGSWTALQGAQPGKLTQAQAQEMAMLKTKKARLEKVLEAPEIAQIMKSAPDSAMAKNAKKIARELRKVDDDIDSILGHRQKSTSIGVWDPQTGKVEYNQGGNDFSDLMSYDEDEVVQ